jgi:MFS family permease
MNLRQLAAGNVGALAVISLLNDAASEMIYPLLPVFLTTVLGAGPTALGLIEGVAESTASLMKVAGGYVSDRSRRRKPLVAWGYGIAAFVRPSVALATAPWHVLAVRFSDRIGKGLRTAPRDALLVESVAPENRGAAFGLHRGADHFGAILGPLIASGLLLAMPGRLRVVFALALVPGVLSLLVLWGGVRESRALVDVAPERASPPASPLGADFSRYLAVVLLFTLGNASDAFLLLRAAQLGVAPAAIPLLWVVLHVSKAAWSVPGGMAADRFGARPVIAAGWLFYALVYAGFAAADSAWQVWLLFAAYGLFFGLTEAPEKSLVARLAPEDARGRAFGWFHGTVGIAALPASLLFGWISERWSAPAALLTSASLALLAAALLPLVVRKDRTRLA